MAMASSTLSTLVEISWPLWRSSIMLDVSFMMRLSLLKVNVVDIAKRTIEGKRC